MPRPYPRGIKSDWDGSKNQHLSLALAEGRAWMERTAPPSMRLEYFLGVMSWKRWRLSSGLPKLKLKLMAVEMSSSSKRLYFKENSMGLDLETQF